MLRATFFLIVSVVTGYLLGAMSMGWPEGAPNAAYASLLSTGPNHYYKRITRTAIINTFAERYNYRSYLEVGQGHRKDNHEFVECAIKVGVDPDRKVNAAYRMTSDEFFEINNDHYDLIFIDGLHTAEQTYRDIINSLQVLNENGTLVVHDCNPANEKMQMVPRTQSVWTGDVWKAWVKLRASRGDLEMYVVDVDYGCGVIRRGMQETIEIPKNLSFAEFRQKRKDWLNLVDIHSFLAKVRSGLPEKQTLGHRNGPDQPSAESNFQSLEKFPELYISFAN